MTAPSRPHADLLRSLEGTGCPACRRGEHADQRYIFGFVYEHHSDWQTLAELRQSLGFCDVHTRRLLRRPEAKWVLPVVYADVVSAALERLDNPARDVPVRPCPMCESREAAVQSLIRAAVPALNDPEVGETYRANGGFCFPHLLDALSDAGPDEAPTLVQAFEAHLGSADEPQVLIEIIAGHDCDRTARHEASVHLSHIVSQLSARGVRECFREKVALGACTSCLAAGLMERRYLAWVGTESRANPSSLASEGVWLCARHLHDLAQEDDDAVAWVASLEQSRLGQELERLTHGMLALPAKTIRGRFDNGGNDPRQNERQSIPAWRRFRRALTSLVRSRRRALRELMTPFLCERYCGACRAVTTAEERETALLLAMLLDRPTAELYESAHGLCLRHVLALPEPRRAGTLGPVLRARLSQLAWELEEAGRKSSWSVRYEPHGDELTAWRRAPAQLDGRVFLGGPPPA